MSKSIIPEIRVSVDVGCHSHSVTIGLSGGELVEEFEIDHTPEGFNHFFTRIARQEARYDLPVSVAMEGYNGYALEKPLIAETCEKQRIVPGRLTVHADRGSSMKSKPVAHLLAGLGVTKSHSRPHVSDDNPYSEAQFKTLKYCPGFPNRFGCFEDALAFCKDFFHFYNHEHRHSGIGLMTPYSVHYGLAEDITAARQITLLDAYNRHPERFVRHPPLPPILPEAAWINPPEKKTMPQDTPESTIVTLDDSCVFRRN